MMLQVRIARMSLLGCPCFHDAGRPPADAAAIADLLFCIVFLQRQCQNTPLDSWYVLKYCIHQRKHG